MIPEPADLVRSCIVQMSTIITMQAADLAEQDIRLRAAEARQEALEARLARLEAVRGPSASERA